MDINYDVKKNDNDFNKNCNKELILKKKKKKLPPTFLNRLIGILPSDDPISLLKYKLRIYKIIMIIIGLVILTTFFSITNFTQRITSFNIEYNNQTYLPETYLIFNLPNVTDIYLFLFLTQNIETNTFDKMVVEGSFDYTNDNITIDGTFSNCIITDLSDTSFILGYVDECIYLYENQQIIIRIYKTSENETKPWDIYLVIDDEYTFLNSDVQMSTSLTKSQVTYQNGETNVNYKISASISHSIKGVPVNDTLSDIFSYGMSFSSNMVLEESTQTNLFVLISIFSNIGSMLTVLLTASDVFFSYLTKFLIRDKSGWVDDEVRECIIRNSYQIKKEYILKKNVFNKDNHGDSEYENETTLDGNENENKSKENQGINENLINPIKNDRVEVEVIEDNETLQKE
ncbi:hypothetical protein ACTA71_003984 [Dictyostelium dimigraforme]